MENYAKRVSEWLEHRVRVAEANNPELAHLKQQISELGALIEQASGAEQNELIARQNVAIMKLINIVQ